MVARAKGARGRADRLFSQLVRSRGVCEAEGERWHLECAGHLETSHMLSRRFSWTRTEFDNALCLCSSAHRYVSADPGAHWELVAKIHSPEHWLDLRERAGCRDKFDWDRRAAELAAMVGARL